MALDIVVAALENLDALFVVLRRDQRVEAVFEVEAGLTLAGDRVFLLLFYAFLFFLVVLVDEVLDRLREVELLVLSQ